MPRVARPLHATRTNITSPTCANCGAPSEPGAVFCSRCGLNFSVEFKGTPLTDVKEVSPILMRLRESLGDRYSIERELGRGGMATVFLARDLKHDREVAIKVLHPELSASIGAERFEREIKLAAKLQHPHILGLYDSGASDDLLYYVMPFVRGESLRDRLDREGMLPIEDAERITLEVCSALGHAHALGIVHRDIKPENILLAGDHSLVADFGIASAASEAGKQKLTQTGMAVGTPVYMAPEQSTGDTVGPAADLYSLGCVLYEMLAGEPPFTGPNAMAIMARHLMETVPSVRVVRSAVPEELEQTIFIALNKQAVDRPQTAQQFAALLGSPMGTTGMMRRPTRATQARGRMTTAEQALSPMEEPSPWWRRPAMLAVTAAALLMLTAGGVWAYRSGRPTVALDPNAKRVAVLYIGDQSRDSSMGPLADGLTEGLHRALSQASSITLIPRSGSERFRGSTAEAAEIARELRAGYLVRGEIEPEGDRVRMALRLLHSTGVTVERASFAISRDSVLLLQDSIASVAANLLGRALRTDIRTQQERVATSSNEAWLAVQQGSQLQRDAERLRAGGDDTGAWQAAFAAADSAYGLAETRDARWAEPITRRSALAYRRSRLVGRDPALIRPWVETGIGHADRALALAPTDPDALEMRGTLRYFGVIQGLDASEEGRDEAFKAAQADLELSTSQNPNQAGAWTTLSHLYNSAEGKDQSDVLIAAKNALRADEFQTNAAVVHQRLFAAAYDLAQFDQAEQYCSDLGARFPRDPRAVRCQLYLLSVPRRSSFDVPRAWRLADSLVLSSPAADTLLARLTGTMFVAATVARQATVQPSLADSARQVARRSLGDATIDPPRDLALFAAYVFTILGDEAEAIRLLGTRIAVNPARFAPSMREDPGWFFAPIKDRPAFQRLVNSYR